MTVSSTTRKAGPFAGNGVTTVFPFTFKVFDKTNAKVLLVNAGGASTTLVLDSDYSVSLSANQNSTPGGSITYPISGSPMPAGFSLVMLGDLPYDQETDITNSGGFYPNVIEDMSDRSTIQIQQLAEITSRAIVITEAESLNPVLPNAAARASQILGFDALGNVTLLPLPASIGAGDMRDEIGSDGKPGFVAGTDFIAGTTTQFVLSRAPTSKANTWLQFDGTNQGGDQILSIAGNILTLTSPVPLGTQRVYVRTGTTLSLNIPAQQSVTDASLSPGSTIGNLVSNHWRVRTDANTNYDGIDQTAFPEAPVLNYAGLESFGWSMRNSKHTAKEIYQEMFPGQSFFDGVQGVTSIVPGMAIGQATGVAGYVKNRAAATGINGNGVALFGAATAEVDNAAVWGLNTLLQDSDTRAAGTGVGRILIGAELDFNVMNPATELIGVSIGGNSLAQPAQSNGFIVNSLGNGNKWGTGFETIDGAAFIAINIGKAVAGTVANTASQPIYFQYVDFAGAGQNGQIQISPNGASAGGTFTFGGTAKLNLSLSNGDLLLATNHALNIGGNNVVSNRIGGYGAPTGGSRISSFPGATATLLQTSQMLAQLMVDLQTHGLIGA